MKKILVVICISLCTLAVEAQTIHWMTFIDTTDPNVGAIDVCGRQMLYRYFIDEVNAALAQKGYKFHIQDFYGEDVSPEYCKKAVESLEIYNSDDIIVFYYIGHGARPATDIDYMDSHPFPQICLAQHEERKFIPLEWIDEQLSSKGARLSVTIGMCCNNIVSNVCVKEEPIFAPNYGMTYMSDNKTEKIQELFLDTKGHIIATSASPSQTSGCFQIDGMIPCPDFIARMNPWWFRDRYSFAICSFFQTQLDEYRGKLTWDSFLSNISWFVDKYSNHEQTPIHKIYVAKAPRIKVKEPQAPSIIDIQETLQKQKENLNNKQQTVEIPKNQGETQQAPLPTISETEIVKKVTTIEEKKEIDMWKNELTNYLTTLINVQLPDTERFELEHRLSKELFANGAQVKFLGQDSDDVIDRADVSDWLGILATNPNGRILMVNVVEGSFDSNNRIKSLKVREVYKK